MTTTTISLDDDFYELVKEEANFEGKTVTNLMREAIFEYLEDKMNVREALESINSSKGEKISREEMWHKYG